MLVDPVEERADHFQHHLPAGPTIDEYGGDDCVRRMVDALKKMYKIEYTAGGGRDYIDLFARQISWNQPGAEGLGFTKLNERTIRPTQNVGIHTAS